MHRVIILLLVIFHLLVINTSAYNDHSLICIFPPDSVPPPPPGSPGPLTGPAWVCAGESCVFSIDVPVACSCQWTVNGVLQTETGSALELIPSEPGTIELSVVILCSGGGSSGPETITTIVFGTPQPTPVSGDETVCEYTYHTYSTIVGPNDSCQWTVNGMIMPGYGSSISYSFGASGIYHFEVVAFNPCGTSLPQTLDVTAQGTAPETPGPVQGASESCTGNTDLYTTTVGPGETCAWWIDGILQASTTTTLEVNWTGWGNRLIEVRAVSDCGTGNPAYKDVSVMYEPEVFLGNDTTILQGQALVLDAGNPGSEYLWSTGATTQTIVVTTTGTYSVTVFNYCGSASDEIEVSVFVGTDEFIESVSCFSVLLSGRKLVLRDLPGDFEKIRVYSVTGALIFEGNSSDEISLSGHGIFLVRVTGNDRTCCRKILLP